jgi:hypothetical protein
MQSFLGLAPAATRAVSEPEPISIKFSARSRQPAKDGGSRPREEFWSRIQETLPDPAKLTFEQLEAKLLRELPQRLKTRLVSLYSEPLETSVSLEDSSLLRRIEDLIRTRERDDYDRTQLLEEFANFLERRARSDNPALQLAEDKLVAAKSLIFVVRIENYQSLNLSLLIGSIEALARVFDASGFNLQLFLEAFAGLALADVFGQPAFDAFETTVKVPPSLTRSMAMAIQTRAPGVISEEREASPSARENARKQAQSAYRLATTTWLLPVFIALAVTYFALKELRSISAMREGILAPLIAHQFQLLEEDRRRLIPGSDTAR